MDGTGKNVKMKRKARKPEKDEGSAERREWCQPTTRVGGNAVQAICAATTATKKGRRSQLPEKLLAIPAAIGTSNFSC